MVRLLGNAKVREKNIKRMDVPYYLLLLVPVGIFLLQWSLSICTRGISDVEILIDRRSLMCAPDLYFFLVPSGLESVTFTQLLPTMPPFLLFPIELSIPSLLSPPIACVLGCFAAIVVTPFQSATK